ncbi:phosphate transport system substrate-binding protein [Paenibacillus phyllosphaerae]|uniref:Phosphate transport system substrate-binding protein n=1 Tax=Paenibacillus phyllosphaerae TaxID=274593 RepID=A0A7W5FR32_9BACL|nr:substrate-binding domain-containing protein [Paenibacillus phyllosphaerae]MBB3113877.1 phosphate transport system substrate-binding protein [Paenibacillus phyllosphaerae]
MKKTIPIWHIALVIVLVPLVAVVGFLGMIFTSLAGGGKFYTPLVFVMSFGLVILLLLSLVKRIPRKWYLTGFAAFLFLGGASVAVHELRQAYRDSFEVMKAEVDLYAYQPFEPGTQAALLQEPSTLTISNPLPRLDGATALYPLYAAFAQAVYPSKTYPLDESEVLCSTTPMAYQRLLNGEADMIFAGPPSEEQLYEANRRGIELKLTPIGREAFVFFVQADNPVDNVALEDLRDIYAGNITNWQAVGGNRAKIRAFQRPANSGSQTMLEKIMEGRPLMAPPQEDVAVGMGDIIDQTADYRNYPNALGYSFLFYATQMVDSGDIRLLKIDGVAPSRETIASGAYPLSMEWYAITAETDNPNVQPFIEWMLSEQGQRIVEATGYTPIGQTN